MTINLHTIFQIYFVQKKILHLYIDMANIQLLIKY